MSYEEGNGGSWGGGFCLGFLFGLLGLIIGICLGEKTKKGAAIGFLVWMFISSIVGIIYLASTYCH